MNRNNWQFRLNKATIKGQSISALPLSFWKVAWNRPIMLRDFRGIAPFRSGKKSAVHSLSLSNLQHIIAEASDINIAYFATIISINLSQLYQAFLWNRYVLPDTLRNFFHHELYHWMVSKYIDSHIKFGLYF